MDDSRIHKFIIRYLSVIVFVFGTVGNIFSLIVLCRKNTRSMKLAKPLMCLSISDIIVLCSNLTPVTLYTYEIVYFENSQVICWLGVAISAFSIGVSAWITAMITVERAISICFPIANRSLSVRFWTKLFIFSISSSLMIFDLYLYYEWASVTPSCMPGNDISFHEYLQMVIEQLMPILIVFICNMAIVFRLYYRPNLGTVEQRATGIINLVVVINVTFLLTNLPRFIFFTCFSSLSPIYMLYVILLACISSAINFILYILASSQFRKEIKNLCRKKPSQNQNCFIIASST